VLAGTPGQATAQTEADLAHYEGLIFTTAQRLVRQGVEAEMEDIQQILRIRVWKAIERFDASRGKPRDKYVFMVVFDGAKDIAKKKRRGELLIEDIAPANLSDRGSDSPAPRDKFEERYLSADHEEVYGEVDEGELHLPNTLNERERGVLDLMRRHYRQTEIADVLGITKREVESAVRGIRIKLADWRPDNRDVHAVSSV
jgi:RNA polymerase sigma factor (sigma-70 family)